MSAAPDLRVLIVEDDDDVAALHERLISRTPGFAVAGRAATLRAALQGLTDVEPDLVLLDMHLPDGSGLDLLRRLRAARPDAFDVIAVTAAADLPSVEQSMRLGVADYLVKPFPPAELPRRLEAYAAGLRSRRGLAEPRLTQEDIDRLRAPAPAPAGLPKGLSEQPLERVVEELRGRGPQTAAELGEALGMSRVSARRYLEHLAREGRAEAEPQYGEVGRPKLRYRWLEGEAR